MLNALTCIFFILIGLALGCGGGWLVTLGGSPFYLFAGIMFLITAVLLWKRRAMALWVYGILVLVALGWAVWEVGFDWWQLGPRGGMIIVLGLWMLTPWVRRPLGFHSRTDAFYPANPWPLAVPVIIAVLVAGYSMTTDPNDMAGILPTAVAANAPMGGDMPDGEWHQYGRTPFGQRYSPLAQITPTNVSDLKLAWQYETGDIKRADDVGETTYQVTPLKIGGNLYLCTPHNLAIALDAATGKEKWRFDPNSGMNPNRQHQTCRGVSYYHDVAAERGSACAERVYLPTSDARLIALDAANGKVCETFAKKGRSISVRA